MSGCFDFKNWIELGHTKSKKSCEFFKMKVSWLVDKRQEIKMILFLGLQPKVSWYFHWLFFWIWQGLSSSNYNFDKNAIFFASCCWLPIIHIIRL
jgi:hypothetical protein